MPKENNKYYVLNELRELSDESDRLADLIPPISILDGYFPMLKETALKIKECTSVKQLESIKFPSDIKTFIGGKQRVIKNINADVEENHRAHLHAEKDVHTSDEITDRKADKEGRSSKVVVAKDKGSEHETNLCTSENKEFKEQSLSVTKGKKNQDLQLHKVSRKENEVPICPLKNTLENRTPVSEEIMVTPVINRTFNKSLYKAVIMNSASANKSNQKSNVIGDVDIRTTRSNSKKLLENSATSSSQKITPSGSKIESQMNQTFNMLVNNTVILDSESATKSDKGSYNVEAVRITRSSSNKLSENMETSGSQKLTRSGSKRKSSVKKSQPNKRPKTEKNNGVSKSSTKASKSKQPHIMNSAKLAPVLSLSNKMKPVIVPTMKQSTSMATFKEKLILEEIKKKEEKANENRKKVLAERQLKVEESKKKRNEKMEKTLQKRMMMEKEKEERLEKKEIDKKAQPSNKILLESQASNKIIKKQTPVKNPKTKELMEYHAKENNPVLASKQNEVKEPVFKTPIRKSNEFETYDLTPAPDSSTYDFSDDEDKPSGKPIPPWAIGMQLRLALTNQYYNPPNADAIFGTYIEPPNLSEIFGVNKKVYTKRTSSAIWHSPPNQSFYS